MKDLNMFSMIQSHASWKDSLPTENLFTSVFSFMLHENNILKKEFCFLFDKSINPALLIVNSQEQYMLEDYKRIADIVLKDDENLLLIENKIGDELKECQLDGYLKILKTSKYRNSKLIVISLKNQNILNNNTNKSIVRLRWTDIYRCVERAIEVETGELGSYLLKEFKEFMEEHNMTPFSGIKGTEFKSGPVGKAIFLFEGAIKQVLKSNKQRAALSIEIEAEDSISIYATVKIKKNIYWPQISIYKNGIYFAIGIWKDYNENYESITKILNQLFCETKYIDDHASFKVNSDKTSKWFYADLKDILSEASGDEQKQKFVSFLEKVYNDINVVISDKYLV